MSLLTLDRKVLSLAFPSTWKLMRIGRFQLQVEGRGLYDADADDAAFGHAISQRLRIGTANRPSPKETQSPHFG